MTLAFSKIAKAVADFISHISITATASVLGHVKLTNSVTNTSTTTAATPASVKTAYDLANNALNSLNTHKSSADHDGRYYTEAEVNSLLAGKSDSTHTHDERYYTESEINDRFKSLKMVYTAIVSQNTGVTLEPNSAYLLFSMQDMSGEKANPHIAYILVGNNGVNSVTSIVNGDIWDALPAYRTQIWLNPKSGYYNYTSIIKVI